MPRLIYIVDVESGDPRSDIEYLQALQKTFRMITEDLSGWGYSQDETGSSSKIGPIEEMLTDFQQTERHESSSD